MRKANALYQGRRLAVTGWGRDEGELQAGMQAQVEALEQARSGQQIRSQWRDKHLGGQQGQRHVIRRATWRLMQHMETDYKVFVHVFEPQTVVPVAQDDSVPHRGGYPTHFWAAGETVVDHVPIDLATGAPGSYGVAIGVYDPATLERLAVVDGMGVLQADGRLVLPEEIVTISSRTD